MYNNYLQITNDEWDRVWDAVFNSNNAGIIHLKNSLFNEYNSLIHELESINFLKLLSSLSNVNLESLPKLKELFNSKDLLQDLNKVYIRIENINILFNSLKTKLSILDFNTICRSLPLFSDDLGCYNFLSNIRELYIRANVISNTLIDSNNNIVAKNNKIKVTKQFSRSSYLSNLKKKLLDKLVKWYL